MTIDQINERIAKAEEFISKKQNTIAKKEASIVKKTAELAKLTTEHDIYWKEAEINWLKNDIKSLLRKISEKQNTLEKLHIQQGNAKKINDVYKELPDVLKNLEKTLTESWTKTDIESRSRNMKELDEVSSSNDGRFSREGLKAWNEIMHRLTGWQKACLDHDEDWIKSENAKIAHDTVIDAYSRVYAITGKVTNWSNWTDYRMDGYAEGVTGKAKIHSIWAGGYNIQRLHVRVLVHEMK